MWHPCVGLVIFSIFEKESYFKSIKSPMRGRAASHMHRCRQKWSTCASWRCPPASKQSALTLSGVSPTGTPSAAPPVIRVPESQDCNHTEIRALEKPSSVQQWKQTQGEWRSVKREMSAGRVRRRGQWR